MRRIDDILNVIRSRSSYVELALGYHDWLSLVGGPTEDEWDQLMIAQRDRLLTETLAPLRIWILAELISVSVPLNAQSLSTSREDDVVAIAIEQVNWLISGDHVLPPELDHASVIIVNLLECAARSPLSSLDDLALGALKRIVGNNRSFSGVSIVYARRALEVLPVVV